MKKKAIKNFAASAIVGVLLIFGSCSKDSFENEVLNESTEGFTVAALKTSTNQAENYDAQNGGRIVGGTKVGYITNGDWIRFEDFDFDGATSVSVVASSARSGGTIEFRAGGPNSDLLGTVNISNTGGWNNFRTFTANVNDDSDNSDLYLVFKGGGGFLFDIDSFTFSGSDEVPIIDDTNLALGKTAEQSSTAYSGSANRAIDGNTSGVWGQGSVTHTASSSRPWWQVRLGDNYEIGQIVVWNRTNCSCVDRLSDFEVLVYNEAGSQVYQTTITNTPSPSVTINTGGVTGSRVRVRLRGTNPLSLAEVQVFGEERENPEEIEEEPVDPNPNPGGSGSAAAIIGSGWKLNGYTGNLNVSRSDNGLDYDDDSSTSESHYFFEKDGFAAFRCYAGNPTSSNNTSNPRSELREIINGGSNYWDGTTNTERSMKMRFKVEDLPPSGKLAFMQIHEREDPFDDVVRIQVQGSGGQNSGAVALRINGYVTEDIEGQGRTVDFDMRMDTEYHFELTMQRGVVTLYNLNNNGSRVETLFRSVNIGDADENYFKAGCYLQSTNSNQSGSSVYGQVLIKDLIVRPND